MMRALDVFPVPGGPSKRTTRGLLVSPFLLENTKVKNKNESSKTAEKGKLKTGTRSDLKEQ
jgi:hypothetical protein